MKRIYVAGPMSGLPNYNYPTFFAAAEALRADGWHVENPADCPLPQGSPWAEFMRYGLAQLITCDAIYLLPGWENSRGAVLERKVALSLGLEVRGHSSGRDADELYRALCEGYTLEELQRRSLTFKTQIDVLRGRSDDEPVAELRVMGGIKIGYTYANASKYPDDTKLYVRPPAAISRDTIRRVFMAHGFTIKENQSDLKPYVYEAAEALLRTRSGESRHD